MTTIILLILITIFIILLYIHFSKEITKEEYDNKRELLKLKDFNRIKRKINRRLNRRYTHFNINSKYNHAQNLIEEYLKKLHFENVKITKWHGDGITYEFEINE